MIYHNQEDENSNENFEITYLVLPKVLKFVNKLKQLSPSLRFKLVNKRVFKLFSDLSSDYSFYLNNKFLSHEPTQLESLKYNIYSSRNLISQLLSFIIDFFKRQVRVLLPGSTILLTWEFVIMVLTIINLMYVPLEVCFDFGPHQSLLGWLLMEMLPSYVFLIDIFVSFFKAYYDKGILISRKKEIFFHYLQGELVIDLIVVLPFFLRQVGVIQTNYFMLLRVTKVRVMLKTIEDIMNFREKPQAIFELGCMVYYLILMGHFFACIFNKFAQIEKEYYNYPITWLDAQGIYDEDWITRYIFGVYFTAITTMTIGFGDVTPVTNPERIFASFLAFVITGVIGYVISKIGQIISKFDPANSSYYQQISIINNHMKKRGLSLQLQYKVKTYFEHYFQLKTEEHIDLQDLIGQMNNNLREEVQVTMYKNYLRKSDFLSQNFSDAFLSSLCQKIFEKIYQPEENILTKNDHSSNLIFVLHGEVESYVPKSQNLNKDTHLQSNHSGFVIGERQFFFNEASNFFIRAVNFVHTAQITKEDFTNILKRFPDDHEKYCYRRERFMHREAKENNTVCSVCQTSHNFDNCPYTFVFLNKNRFINNFTYNIMQTRKKFRRNKRQTIYPQSLVKNHGLQIIISQFIQSNVSSVLTLLDSNNKFLEQLGLSQKDIQRFKESELSTEIEQYVVNMKGVQYPQQEQQTLMQKRQLEQHKDHLLSLFDKKNIQPEIKAASINTCIDIDKIYMVPNKYYYPSYNINEITKNYNLLDVNKKKLALMRLNNRVTIHMSPQQDYQNSKLTMTNSQNGNQLQFKE